MIANILTCAVVCAMLAMNSCASRKSKCNCEGRAPEVYKPTISKTDSIPCAQFVEAYAKHGWYGSSGVQFFVKDAEYYLAFVNSHLDSLIIVPILNPDTAYYASLKGYIDAKDADAFLIQDDTLHIIDGITKEYRQFAIDSGFGLSLVKQVGLFAFFPRKAVMNGNSEIDKKISYKSPYLLLPYLTVGKFNYAGKHAVLEINLKTNKRREIVDYPAIYHQCDYLWVEPFIFTEGKDIITLFPSSDEIQVHNLETGDYKFRSSGHSFANSIICYDSRYTENLAYDENYQLTSERNKNIFKKGEKYYLFKQLRKKDRNAITQTAVLIFDKNLKFERAEILTEDVHARLTFVYRNKFAIYSYSSKSFFLYDI